MSAMELLARIDDDLKDAMRARDEVAKLALRAVKAALTEARKSEPRQHDLNEQEILAVIRRVAKMNRDAIVEFEKAGREDLAAKERAELTVVERYLPRQLSEAEIEEMARSAIAETGASNARDLGKVMPLLMRQVAGRADGRMVNQIVRHLLE
jgi:uncharacterized protein